MSGSALTSIIITGCLLAAILLGSQLRRRLSPQHLTADTKEILKLTTGLVATMTALVLGLLVSSAKDSYDANRTQVIQMAAKITLLDRLLGIYGPESAEARGMMRAAVEDSMAKIWPADGQQEAQLAANVQAGNSAYAAVLRLDPHDDAIRVTLKAQASTLVQELGAMRTLLEAQSVTSISTPLLAVVVCWLSLIFLSFTLLAPANATANAALIVSVFSCAAALLLILELDRPFTGLIKISSDPLQHACSQLAKPAP